MRALIRASRAAGSGAAALSVQNDTINWFFLKNQFDQFRVNMFSIRYHLAGEFGMDHDGAYGSGIPVMKPTHGIEEMGRVKDSCLETFHHMFIFCIGVARLENDSFLHAIQGQMSHSFQFRCNGHIYDLSVCGVIKAAHQIKVNKADTLRFLKTRSIR